jgi:uncharacterized alkaline shock family protein YloU
VVTDHAASQLAVAAAGEVPGVLGVGSRGLGRLVSGGGAEDASVLATADVRDDRVSLDLTVALAYPRPVRETLEQLAGHVAGRMGVYGGLRVERLHVTVRKLGGPGRQRRSRVE